MVILQIAGRKRTSAQAAIEVPFVEKKGADVLNQSDFMDLLRIYYRMAIRSRCTLIFSGLLFPFKSMFRWLSYGGTVVASDTRVRNGIVDVGLFSRREFSMTLPGDVYIRYLNYSSMDKFKDVRERPCSRSYSFFIRIFWPGVQKRLISVQCIPNRCVLTLLRALP